MVESVPVMEITIKCDSKERAKEQLTKIHENLKGNQDYIDNNIILSDRLIEESNSAEVIVFPECTTELDLVSIVRE